MSDDWAQHMKDVEDFLSENFKKRSMGLVCDNSEEITKVYTAVFPSNDVMQKIIARDETDIMLFVHHPSIWDIRNAPEVFQQMDRKLLQQFKDRKISIYNLHVPLDNYGEYSTSVTLAKALGIETEKAYAPYFGALCGVVGKTDCSTVEELKERLEKVIGHKAGIYTYGDKMITKVGVVAGGGNDVDILQETAKEGVNVLVTGITAKNDHSKPAHDFASEHKINLIGGTHYSTEQFACIAMCDYFKKLGLDSEFIGDKPVLEDI
ncbi:Nif3-like dinuclear metal center hexameric protein [Thermoproteota archaeon]